MADDLVSKQRAERCVTHHHACDCREWEHACRVEELESAVAHATATGTAKLAAFGAWCAREFREHLADIDGGSAQDAMERLGVLERREVTESCGEGCVCAQVTDFPTDCYVFPDDVRDALAREEGK